MKILWLTIDRSMRVMQHFDMLQNIMSEKGVVKIIKRKTDNIMAAPYSIQTMVTKERKCLPFDFDWINFDIIFCDALFAYAHKDWGKITKPRVVLLEDLHGPVVRNCVLFLKKYGVESIIHRYRNPMKNHIKVLEA